MFTQSLESMDLIEKMLQHPDPIAQTGPTRWANGKDYGKLTGESSGPERTKTQKSFNDPANKRLRLLLISTKAGSLGTNLVAASRVVLFDANWNPRWAPHRRKCMASIYLPVFVQSR